MYIQSILCTSRGPNWFKTLSLQNRGGPRLEVKNGRKGQKILANQWTQLEWKMSLKHRSKKKLNQKVIDPERIRTSNLLIRSQTRYPLRHGTLLWRWNKNFDYQELLWRNYTKNIDISTHALKDIYYVSIFSCNFVSTVLDNHKIFSITKIGFLGSIDSASDYESEGWRFKSSRDQIFFI